MTRTTGQSLDASSCAADIIVVELESRAGDWIKAVSTPIPVFRLWLLLPDCKRIQRQASEMRQ
jgi:hypothetical protein